jgi:hypothetical protein
MAMTPVETIETLRSAGFSLDVEDGKLVLDGHGLKPSGELRDAVAQHAQRIVEILLIPRMASTPKSAPPCRSCGRPQHQPDVICGPELCPTWRDPDPTCAVAPPFVPPEAT